MKGFFFWGGGNAAKFLMIMYLNLMTVSFLSQFYKIGDEFCVVLDKSKMDLASMFCIFIC